MQQQEIKSIQIELDIKINASVERVWTALTGEINNWWHKDFYASPKSTRFNIEPYLSGRLFESAPDGSAISWGNVIAINIGNSIDFAGYLTPAFGGPAVTMLHIELKDENNSTLLKVTDATFGKLFNNSEETISKGWKYLFEEGLKKYLESPILV
jgi:uncharacterized protein YndB with AHSA1/START domain